MIFAENSSASIRLLMVALGCNFAASLYGQAAKPAPVSAAVTAVKGDAAGCVDSTALPRMQGCRIDNCETKDYERRDVPVGKELNGDPVIESMEGELKAVMYECAETVSASQIVQRGANLLKLSGYKVPYVNTDAEAELSAQLKDTWILVEAIAKYYTLYEFKVIPPEPEPLEAKEMAEAIEKTGHVALYGLEYDAARMNVMPESESIMDEVLKLLKGHPELKVRIEVNTDNTGLTATNHVISRQRASTLVAWLVAHGIDKSRLAAAGNGESKPIADIDTAKGRMLNRRVDLVKIIPK